MFIRVISNIPYFSIQAPDVSMHFYINIYILLDCAVDSIISFIYLV